MSDTVAPLPAQLLDAGPVTGWAVTRLFRGVFNLSTAPPTAELRLFSTGIYHVWINNHYLGRGPAYHHPFRWPFDRYDVAAHLRQGKNVVAILFHTPGISLHNQIFIKQPGIASRLRCDAATFDSDASWKMTTNTGWSDDVPRRSWAIGQIESYDASAAPVEWQSPEFDDSGWSPAKLLQLTAPLPPYVERPIPMLRYGFAAPVKVIGTFSTTAPPRTIAKADGTGEFAKSLEADWQPAAPGVRISPLDPATGGFTITGLRKSPAAIVCFDLGEEFVGQVVFDCDCPTTGTIDIGWSEQLENGRPKIIRKGVSYADRFHAVARRNQWQPIGYTAARYLVLVLRDFEGEIRFTRFGMLTSEPDVPWFGSFHSMNAKLDAVFNLCARSQRIGTQDGQLDCPTREQAPYVGDGVITARWFAQLSGDLGHYKNIINELFRRQSPSGLVRGSIFTGANDTLIDYTLLAVIALRDYWRFTGDADMPRAWIGACRKILGYFERLIDSSGFCVTNWTGPIKLRGWETGYDIEHPFDECELGTNLFVDHPGMGWHNAGEAGIDRRGTNTAINALLVQTWRALAELEDAFGEPSKGQSFRENAARLAKRIHEAMFDRSRGAYVDGLLDGKQLAQISEQTNTWAVAARCCDDATAAAVLKRVVDNDDAAICRNGPYFWTYLYPELARLSLHEMAMRKTTGQWGKMIDNHATLLWETFAGDDMDSYCHPWSGAPLEYLLLHVAGLPSRVAEGQTLLRPRYDLLERCSASIMTARGEFTIAWQRRENGIDLTATLPPGVNGELVSPSGQPIKSIRGEGKISLTVATR